MSPSNAKSSFLGKLSTAIPLQIRFFIFFGCKVQNSHRARRRGGNAQAPKCCVAVLCAYHMVLADAVCCCCAFIQSHMLTLDVDVPPSYHILCDLYECSLFVPQFKANALINRHFPQAINVPYLFHNSTLQAAIIMTQSDRRNPIRPTDDAGNPTLQDPRRCRQSEPNRTEPNRTEPVRNPT